MRRTNAYIIQEELKKAEFITVPQVQREYGLSYFEAKEFMEILMEKEWIKPASCGKYSVIRENLRLYKITREDVPRIIEIASFNTAMLLRQLRNKNGVGEAFRGAGHGRTTEKGLKILEKHKLIYKIGDLYYLAVSRKTVDVIMDVAFRKECDKNEDEYPSDYESLVRLFGVLLDD